MTLISEPEPVVVRTSPPFRRIAILNRADAAVRFLRAAREVGSIDGTPLEVVAFYTDPDRHAPFVRLADAAVSLGPALRTRPDGSVGTAYADHDLVIDRLLDSGCDAVWPGWGFVSEDADFVTRLEAEGIVFLGPSSSAMRALGDKIESKRLAEASGVPLAPWAEIDPEGDEVSWAEAATSVGYPLMVKASAGGGGRGIRKVVDPVDLPAAVRSVTVEARASFGEGGIFLERCLVGARHVEVQFLVDADGVAQTFGVRDCTVQRRHQKVIEEAPSPVLSPVEESRLTGATARLARAAGYRGVGTAEFLYVADTRIASFCEVNARLQVEHTVTELVWGIDLVRAQIAIAAGLPTDHASGPRGWAVEARLVAEDAERGFAPAPGKVLVHRPPMGPNIRVDAGVRAGSQIPTEFDSLVAKVVAWGPTRERAMDTLRRGLAEYEVVIEDGATNRGVLLDLLARPDVVDATATTDWLDELIAEGSFEKPRNELAAIVLAAITLARLDRGSRIRRFLAGSSTGVAQPDRPATEPVELELSLRGRVHRIEVAYLERSRWLVGSPGRQLEVVVEHLDESAVIMHLEGRQLRALVHRGSSEVTVDVDGSLHRVRPAGAAVVRSPGPALLVDLSVAVGDMVEAGQRVGTVEAMKTEAPLIAEVEGVVVRVLVQPGTQVAASQPIVELEPLAEGTAAEPSAGQVETWEWPVTVDADPRRTTFRALDGLLLGREVAGSDEATARRTLDALATAESDRDDAGWAPLVDRLAMYTDIEALFERNMLLLEDHPAAVSAESAFHEACRHYNRGEDGIRPELRPLLAAALARYDVADFEPTDELRAALWRLSATRSRTADRERLMTSLVRAVAALARRDAVDRSELRDDLATLERAAAGSSPGLANAAALAHSELTDRSPVTRMDVAEVDPQAIPSLARYGAFDLEVLDVRRTIAGRALVVRARSKTDDGDVRTVLALEVDLSPTDLRTAGDIDMAPFGDVFTLGIEMLRRERTRALTVRADNAAWWAAMHILLIGTRHADARSMMEAAQRFDPATRGLALQELTVRLGVTEGDPGEEYALRRRGHARLELDHMSGLAPQTTPRSVLDRRALTASRLGLVDPWELIGLLEGRVAVGDLPHPSLSDGRFDEWDLDDEDRFGPVDRAPAGHGCAVVVGVVANPLPGRTTWAERVLIAGDPVRSMGSLGEPECRRIIAAIDLAADRGLPVEWISLSSGARIAMDSGTENLDWTAAVLRRIVTFTEAGGEIDIVVAGVNVGAQSYWNAEATMLMHTRGLLVMVPGASMVLTGRKALEFSGSVGAEDEVGIGGFDRVMGPNGQAQYRADDLAGAYAILFDHYARTYPEPSTGRPPVLETTDPIDRDVSESPYKGDDGFSTVGEVFDPEINPGRKRPFAIRSVMDALVDGDAVVSERWRTMADANTAVVWESRIGGHAVTLIGMESRPLARLGGVPVDGPSEWAGGTLYPLSSKKVARAIRSASGNRPVVVLANLSGFDGSPESLRRLQLEYGAEIARAVVDFDGPIVFVVIGRYHGGAYVVFSKELHPRLTALALEGSYASVIGGAPAAAVVLTREVRARVEADPSVRSAREALAAAGDGDTRLRHVEQLEATLAETTTRVRADVAAEFDAVHTVERAVNVGSLDGVIATPDLRPAVVSVLDREATADGRRVPRSS